MLNINLSTIVFQIINFLILAFLLAKFLFRPLVRVLSERAKRLTHALDEAEMREEEAKRIKDEYQEKMEDAKREARALRETAREEMEKTRQGIIEQTRADMQAMRARAEEEKERERAEAIKQHKEEIASIVTSLSARMLSGVRHGYHDLFFAAFLDRLAKMEPGSLQFRGDAQETGMTPVEVISADSLSKGDMERLEQVLSSFLGKKLNLESQMDPSLIGGAVVRFGDHLIDGSLRGQLARMREEFVAEMEQG